MKIALVPNDDGYGPSGLGFYIDGFTSTLGVCGEMESDKVRTRILQSAVIGNSPVVKAIKRIKEDEGKTSAVFLFDDYITPEPFQKHWEALNVKRAPIEGVFGGKGLASREKARKRMGISEGTHDKTVYILGGGTPVWDAKLAEIFSQLREQARGHRKTHIRPTYQPGDQEPWGGQQ